MTELQDNYGLLELVFFFGVATALCVGVLVVQWWESRHERTSDRVGCSDGFARADSQLAGRPQ